MAGGKIYAIGGQHHLEKHSTAQSEVDRYDPATNKWTKVASMPDALSHFNAATVLYDRYIITVGGENPHDNPRASVFAYDTVMNKWARLTSLPMLAAPGLRGWWTDAGSVHRLQQPAPGNRHDVQGGFE